jgi:protein O-mannosyl-transferase
MPTPPIPATDSVSGGPPLRWWVAAAVILCVAALPFLPAWGSPFIFDDLVAIKDNPEIARFRVGVDPDSTTEGGPLEGRPFARFTFHLNWRVTGFDPQGFRTVNLLLHLLAALTLGLVGRATLLAESRPTSPSGWNVADIASLAVMGLWAVHPLQTECVNYVTQRTEILAILCLAGTLLGACWLEHTPRSILAYTLMLTSAVAGMASKELMVWAPVFIALGHRTWCAATWRDAWHTRGRIWGLLATTWLVLVLCNLGNPRGSTAGFSSKAAWWEYLAVQGWAWGHYLIQLVWPMQLVIDYGDWAHGRLILASPARWLPGAVVMGLVCGAVLWRWWRAPREVVWIVAGLLWMLPTSSVLPIATEIGADRRLSFPLFCVLMTIARPLVLRKEFFSPWTVLLPVAVIAILWSVVTSSLSRQYQDPVQLWQRAVAVFPDNRRAFGNLGTTLVQRHPLPTPAPIREQARRAFEESVRLDPEYAAGWYGLAGLASQSGDTARAIELAETALRLPNPSAGLLYDYANDLVVAGRLADAIAPYQRAIALKPTFVPFHYNLGICFQRLGRNAEAADAYAEVLRLDPNQHGARLARIGIALQLGQRDAARREISQLPRNVPELAPQIRLIEQLLNQP